MKKITCLLFILTLIVITATGALAEGTTVARELDHNEHYATEEEKQAEFNKQLQDYMKNLHNEIGVKGNAYVYKTEELEHQYATIEGFIGGQPKNGTKLGTSGALFYSKSGGPTISVSVSFPKPFDFISVGISTEIGTMSSGSTGVSLNVPDTEHHFKIRCKKVFEITPLITYQRSRSSVSDDDWEYYAHTSFKVLDTEEYWLVQMD